MPDIDQKRGERLRAARKGAGFSSAAQAARELGWPYATYRSHEGGVRGIRQETAETYGQAFGVSPGWLLFGKGQERSGILAARSGDHGTGREETGGGRILLIISGGIAAYKVLELIRRLRERNVRVRTIMTLSATRFITPLSVEALSHDGVYTDLFERGQESDIGHIRLSREADLVVVAPASANLLSKMANGLADDLASTALLATDKPVMVAPAMNPRMWSNAATQRNVDRLKADGVTFIGPERGEMAERGEAGAGRLVEPATLLAAIDGQMRQAGHSGGIQNDSEEGSLCGLRALVTAGPTHESIDPVRYIANRSSGKQGYAIATALQRAGARVTLISGPVSIPVPVGVELVRVESAREMLAATRAALPFSVAVFAAAVGDWRLKNESVTKRKKDAAGPPIFELVENPDILRTIAKLPAVDRPELVIGFAAETNDVQAQARAKLRRKGCDWIVANDVSPESGIMGGDRNKVTIHRMDAHEVLPELPKDAVAVELVKRIADHFGKIRTSNPAGVERGPGELESGDGE